jgi:sigma-E factor negative regulatory protein RseA
MDGELDPSLEATLLARMKDEGELTGIWNEYHLIGDVLREKGISNIRVGERVAQALSAEPTVLAPRRFSAPSQTTRWLAVAAAVAAVAVSTWTLQRPEAPTSPMVARNEVPSAETEHYVAMHRQWSPLSGFQTVDYAASTVASR